VNAIDGLAAAFMLLTRLPLGRPARGSAPPAPWAFPVVGGVVGLLAGLVLRLAEFEKLPPLLAAGWAVVALLLLTGALHEDGLADTADGLGGGQTAARKLEIMRDSRIGTFGAVALVLSLALRVAALAALADPGRVAVALIAAGMLGRGAMIGVMLALRPARPDGMAAALGPVRIGPAVVGLGIAGACVLLSHGVHALLGAVLAGALMVCLARRQIGGYTGDILGATEQAAECAVLLAMLMR
jgi:adenosylcobinamide-GDP ribazoletransferase